MGRCSLEVRAVFTWYPSQQWDVLLLPVFGFPFPLPRPTNRSGHLL